MIESYRDGEFIVKGDSRRVRSNSKLEGGSQQCNNKMFE